MVNNTALDLLNEATARRRNLANKMFNKFIGKSLAIDRSRLTPGTGISKRVEILAKPVRQCDGIALDASGNLDARIRPPTAKDIRRLGRSRLRHGRVD